LNRKAGKIGKARKKGSGLVSKALGPNFSAFPNFLFKSEMGLVA
jgi:hypothetical protein